MSRLSLAIGSLVAFAGCGEGGLGQAARSLDVPLGPVSVYDSGSWQDFVRCQPDTCLYNFNFWVDLTVAADPQPDTIGFDYSSDGGASWQTAFAHYKGQLYDGRQRWGADVSLGVAANHPDEIQVRAFVRAAGAAQTEPRLHYIYAPVSTGRPVRLLASHVSYDAATGAHVAGRVRVFNFASDLIKEVAIRYTVDGWATVLEAPAQGIGQTDDWSFDITLGGADLPPGVDFAVRYHVPGEEFWDNNNSANFHHTIAPRFDVEFDVPPTQQSRNALSGIVRADGYFSSELPIDRIEARIDDGAFAGGNELVFSTQNLANGQHSVTFRATLVGGYQAVTDSTFGVDNRILPSLEWPVPSPSGQGESPIDLAADGNGRVYVLYPYGLVARYDSVGAGDPARVFYLAADARQLLADDAGRLLVYEDNDQAFSRYLSDGSQDRNFGRVRFGDPGNGGYICPGGIAAGGGYEFALDLCNLRVLRFNDLGQYEGVTPLGLPYWVPLNAWFGNDTLWVLTPSQLLRVDNRGGQPMHLGAVVDVSALALTGPGSLAHRADGTFWSIDASSRLIGFTNTGAGVGSWHGETTSQHLPGELAGATRVVALPDGGLAALAAPASLVEIFR